MKFSTCILILAITTIVFAGGEEDGHVHGPDGRHIVTAQSASGGGEYILSHHDMRIEGTDGKSVLGAQVQSKIYPVGKPAEIVHEEKNVYEPENEVYGSHMTYTEPGEFVLEQAVTMPDGRELSVKFPVYVPALAVEKSAPASGFNPMLIVSMAFGAVALVVLGFVFGKRAGRVVGSLSIGAVLALASMPAVTMAGGEEDGHMHGPDGRHLVADQPGAAGGLQLRAYPGPNEAKSAEKTVDGVKFVLEIENEVMSPDPDLVSLDEGRASLIGLKTASATLMRGADGIETTGRVSANPDGLVAINARASGRIVEVGALPGTNVRSGQTLVVIESEELANAQAEYRRAQAELLQAEAEVKMADTAVAAANAKVGTATATLERQRSLARAGAFATPTLEAARSKVSDARAEVDSIESAIRGQEAIEARLARGAEAGVIARNELERARTELAALRTRRTDAAQQLALANEALAREESISKQGLRNAEAIQSAEADLRNARAQEASAVSGGQYARASVARVRTSLRNAQERIRLMGGAPGGTSRIVISAPINAEVESRAVSLGQTVAAGDALFELLNADLVWVLADLYERDIASVRIGLPIKVVADALPNKIYEGRVAFIHNEIEPTTRTTKVRVVVANPDEALKQNMFVRVIIGTSGSARVLVPTAAIQREGGLDYVFVQEAAGTYRRKLVRVSGSLGGQAVVEGIEAGAKVVTDGAYQLSGLVGDA